MEVSMSEKDIIKAVEYIDNIKSEWITNVTDRLNEFENSSGISLNEMDDEYKLVCTPKTVMTKNTCFRRIAL